MFQIWKNIQTVSLGQIFLEFSQSKLDHFFETSCIRFLLFVTVIARFEDNLG